MTDKIIELIFPTYIQPLQMTKTKEIITCRVMKIHEWVQGDVCEWGKVS